MGGGAVTGQRTRQTVVAGAHSARGSLRIRSRARSSRRYCVWISHRDVTTVGNAPVERLESCPVDDQTAA